MKGTQAAPGRGVRGGLADAQHTSSRPDDASVLAGSLGVLLIRAASCEVALESAQPTTEAGCGLATVVVLRPLQPLRIV